MPNVIIRGADVALYVNGRLFAQVSGFTWSSASPSKEIRGIDNSEPLELGSTTALCSGQMDLYRVRGDGGLEGSGMAVSYEDLPAQKYVSIQLIDRNSDLVIFEASECRIESQGWQVRTKSLMMGTASFKALHWSNETQAAST